MSDIMSQEMLEKVLDSFDKYYELNKKYEMLFNEMNVLKKENAEIKENLENILDGVYVPIITYNNNNFISCEKNVETLEIIFDNYDCIVNNISYNIKHDRINNINLNSLTRLKKLIIESKNPIYLNTIDFRNMKNTIIKEIVINKILTIDFTGIEELKYLESLIINNFKCPMKKKAILTKLDINLLDLKNTMIKEINFSNIHAIDFAGIEELKYLEIFKIDDYDYSMAIVNKDMKDVKEYMKKFENAPLPNFGRFKIMK